jgi:hypothetical protein
VVGQGGTTRATRANSGSLGAGSRAGPIAGCLHIGEAGRGSAAEGWQLVIGSRAGPVRSLCHPPTVPCGRATTSDGAADEAASRWPKIGWSERGKMEWKKRKERCRFANPPRFIGYPLHRRIWADRATCVLTPEVHQLGHVRNELMGDKLVGDVAQPMNLRGQCHVKPGVL